MSEKDTRLINKLLEKLTLEEKIGMIHGASLFRTKGVERLGIPPLKMSDGPMGVRMEFADTEWRAVGNTDDYVTYLPSNSAIAATWNRELAGKAGEVLGEEARGRGKDIILAPGINIKRSPLCGRNFEYMSEDPYLVKELTVPMIRGIQKYDVAACVKHFAANSQETQRLWVDTLVDERTLQEIYYPAFKDAVKRANTYSLMGAYNLLNGKHCCENGKLLDEVLREQWGYDGTIVSDWGAVHNTQAAAECSLDVEMNITNDFDDYCLAKPLLEKVKSGEIDELCIDNKVRNILRMMLRLHMIGDQVEERKAGTYNTKTHQEAVLEVARESVILLKNDNNVLPLKKKGLKKIAVIGQNAVQIHSNGGGSAEVKALYEISPLMGIKKILGGNTEVVFAEGYYIPKKFEESDQNWQATSIYDKSLEIADITRENIGGNSEDRIEERRKQIQNQLREKAVALAKEVEVVILIGGLNHDYDVEGLDREHMRLPYEQDALIQAVLEANPHTIVVIYAGAPVEMPWIEQADSIVWSYYAGMEGGTALAEILWGEVNPSGKLPETFIKKEIQCPAHFIGEFGKKDVVAYKEEIMVGYRYYDTYCTDILFPFGYGLSYTEFLYDDLKVQLLEKENELSVIVEASIKNIGNLEGAEVVQLYIVDVEASVERPLHELKAFEKINLKPEEVHKIHFVLNEEAFSFYSVEDKCFKVEDGAFMIQVGGSSRNIHLEEEIIITRNYFK